MTIDDPPHLLMIAGPNGSGKSSLIVESGLADYSVIINPDNYAKLLPGDKSEIEKYTIAMTQCSEIREELLKEKKTFAFETVASTEEKLEFVKRAISEGYRFGIIFVNAGSPEKCYERVCFRVAKGGHNVPKEKIFSRYERTLSFLKEYINISDYASVFDNSGDSMTLVLKKIDNTVTVTDEGRVLQWVQKYLADFL